MFSFENSIIISVSVLSTIAALLSMVALFDLELEQLDVKTVFLHGELDE